MKHNCMIFHVCSFYRAQGAQGLLMLVKENRLTLLSKIDDVSKKQNDKKSKRMVAAPAAV